MEFIIIAVVFGVLIIFSYAMYVNSVTDQIIGIMSDKWKNEAEIREALFFDKIPTHFWMLIFSFDWKFVEKEFGKIFDGNKIPFISKVNLREILSILTLFEIIEERIFQETNTFDDIPSKYMILLRKIMSDPSSRDDIVSKLDNSELDEFDIAEKRINKPSEIRIDKDSMITKEIKWRKKIFGKKIGLLSMFTRQNV